MGTLRISTYEDGLNPKIMGDKMLDLSGMLYLHLRKEDKPETFEEYYMKNFDHESVYNQWKRE